MRYFQGSMAADVNRATRALYVAPSLSHLTAQSFSLTPPAVRSTPSPVPLFLYISVSTDRDCNVSLNSCPSAHRVRRGHLQPHGERHAETLRPDMMRYLHTMDETMLKTALWPVREMRWLTSPWEVSSDIDVIERLENNNLFPTRCVRSSHARGPSSA